MAFFDNVSKKLSQAGQGALQKTKEMADVARLNSNISEEEKRLNNNYYQIGKIYAQLHSGDCEDCFTAYISAVNESIKKIEDFKSEIQKIRSVAKCSNCGAEIPSSSSFCSVCGAAITDAAANDEEPPVDSVKCENCGNYVNKKMKFCTSCGTPMPQIAEDSPEEEDVNKNEEAKCPTCGATLNGDALFCVECGTKI